MIMETRTNMSSITWLTSINCWSTLLTRHLMMHSTKEQRYVYLILINADDNDDDDDDDDDDDKKVLIITLTVYY